MSTNDLTEEDQRRILETSSGWIPLPGPLLGAGGGARVFKVVRVATVIRLQDQLRAIQSSSGEAHRSATAGLVHFLADLADGGEIGIAAGKVGTHPDHRLKREIETLRDVQHPNLIRMLDYDKSEKPTWYVMPVMEGGTLKDKQDLVGNVPAVVRGMLQVARALAALHSQSHPITHRDIKPGNVFVSGSGEWILGDPGVAYRDDGSDETETRAVSKDWAPRWYADKFARSPKADLYLLGATAIAVLVGEKPLDPSYLDEPAFKLPTRFPEAPGIELLFQLFRKLVVTRLAAMPYKDATELVRELETLLPVIENDRSLDLLAELERFRSVPRLLFSYANSNANLFSGDHDGLKGVPLLIPEDCDRLVIWPRGVKQAGCGLMIFDRWNRQAKASIDLLEYDRPTSLELPADTRGEFVRMTVTRNSGMLYSLTVYAEHGGRRFG